MVKILSKNIDLKKVVTSIKETSIEQNFGVFDRDVGRDEVLEHKSFFLYDENGAMEPVSSTQYRKEFILMFVTREGVSISEIEQVKLIERLRKCGFIFNRMVEEEGRLLGTEDSVSAMTFYFNRIIKICHDED